MRATSRSPTSVSAPRPRCRRTVTIRPPAASVSTRSATGAISTGNASSGYGFTSDLSTAGAVFMNSDYINNGTVDLGTLLHEIGHAIGMKHPDQQVYYR